MRALTIWQPWASLIVDGSKRIENRTRRPPASLIGRLIGIHAGLRVDVDALTGSEPLPMPRSALLGYARISAVVTESDDPWFTGPVGICLNGVVAYPEPISMRGKQGYWDVLASAPRDLLEAFEERVRARLSVRGAVRDVVEWDALYDVRAYLDSLYAAESHLQKEQRARKNARHSARTTLSAGEWPSINRERGSLIDKRLAGTLSASEKDRLDSLNTRADEYLEAVAPRSTKMLDEIEERLRDGTDNREHAIPSRE